MNHQKTKLPNYFSWKKKQLFNRNVSDYSLTICIGVKEILKLANTKTFESIGASAQDPYDEYYPPCNDLPYSSNDYWACRIQHFTLTGYHPTSTCRMGAANDPTAVVDPQMRLFLALFLILYWCCKPVNYCYMRMLKICDICGQAHAG